MAYQAFHKYDCNLPVRGTVPMTGLIDTHIHIDRLAAEQLSGELHLARAAGIDAFVIPGVAPAGWSGILTLARQHPGLYLAPGIHPQAAQAWTRAVEERLSRLLDDPAVVAIGEIGLDQRCETPAAIQEAAFRGQLRLAVACGYPLLLHCRGAHQRLFRIFDEEHGARVGGILHAFSGSSEIARAALRRNLALGFGGSVTWPEARRGPAALRELPAEAFVLETDAPDLAPHPHRGEANRPLWLTVVAARVAELRDCSRDEIVRQTSMNARRILRLPETGAS